MAVLGSNPRPAACQLAGVVDGSQQKQEIVYIIEIRWNLRAGGPEITKDVGAQVTYNCHPGIIRVASHWMKFQSMSELGCNEIT